MNQASSRVSSGYRSSRSFSPSASACSPSASAQQATLSLVEPQNDSAAPGEAIGTMVQRLQEFEALLRKTLAAGGQVAAAMAEASEAERLSAVAGHQIFAAITNANLSISTALTGTAKGHRLLEELAVRLGYATTGYGDVQKDPQVWFTSASAATTDAAR